MNNEAIYFEQGHPDRAWWQLLVNRSSERCRLESTRFTLATRDGANGAHVNFVFVFGQLLAYVVPAPLLFFGAVADIRRWQYCPNGKHDVGESFFTATCRLISVRQRRNMIRVVLEPLDPWLEDKVR